MVHLEAAIARLVADNPPEPEPPTGGEQRYGYMSLPDKPVAHRDEQSEEERARRDAQTNDVLRQLKAEQEAQQ